MVKYLLRYSVVKSLNPTLCLITQSDSVPEGTPQRFLRGGFAPRSNPLPFCVQVILGTRLHTILTQKGILAAFIIVYPTSSLRSKRFRGVQEQRITARKKRGEGERKEGRKRLLTNPWILKTAYLAFHA